MAERGKAIRGPLRHSGGGFVASNLNSHPRRNDLLRVLAQWSSDCGSAEELFAEAISMYEMSIRDRDSIPTLAEERLDLENIGAAAKELQKRLRHFPERSFARAWLALSKQKIDLDAVYDRLMSDLAIMRGATLIGLKTDGDERSRKGGRPKTKSSDAHHLLSAQLNSLLNRHGKKIPAGSAEEMADIVIEILSTQ